MFLVVGYHTSANFMCNGLQLLFDHPDQRAKLERRSELLPNAIEEMMRFHGPAATVRRLAKVDYELRGAQIRAGDTLMLVLASANRDPAVFSEPDRFDIERVNANQHLGFANGPYACLGQALARMEGQVFYETLLRRLSGLRPVDIEPDWVQFRPLEREVESLPVLYDAEPRCG
jgi:cytochrome P450